MKLRDMGDSSPMRIPLSNIKGDIIEMIIQYLTRHRDDPILGAKETKCGDWDRAFFEVSYLGYSPLHTTRMIFLE